MVAAVASFGSLNLVQARPASAGAVMPVPAAPISRDRPQPAPRHTVSAMALAPAAMAALIEAQEHETQGSAPLACLRTVHVLDQLIVSLDAAQTAPGSPASVQRLQVARQRLLETAATA